jgi:hypothetical protein
VLVVARGIGILPSLQGKIGSEISCVLEEITLLIVTNLVLCRISYKFAIGGDDKGNRCEEDSIEAGCQTKLNHLKRSDRIHAAV